MDVAAAYISAAMINLILDLIVIALPMPVLWTLQMALLNKIAISAIFGVGIMYVSIFLSFGRLLCG